MRKILFILLSFPIIVLGQQTISDSIFYNNVYRSYITYIPAIYNSSHSTPLLFNLHGRTGTALGAMYQADFRDISDTANFIIVHPQGLLDSAGDTHWNLGQSAVDDIGFLNSLYSYIVSNYNINLDKVYSTGMSNGGYMSYYLACNMSDKIAAIASVTGAMGPYTQLTCNPAHPTPVLEIHGTADTNVAFNLIFNGLEYWRDYNNCNISPDTFQIPDSVLGDSSTVEHIVYNTGDNGVTTELFKIHNGGHTWPGSSFSIGMTNHDIDASVEIWKFFSRYDINGFISTSTSINEKNIKDKRLVKITDILGRETTTTTKNNTLLFYIYNDKTVEKKIVIN
jgi:polyhydroxybutyrate depolymerase